MAKYTAKTLAGATKRVRQMEKIISRFDELAGQYKRERDLLAKLAAKTPQFDNPLMAWTAEKIRDDILAGKR